MVFIFVAGKVEVVRLLLERGANLALKDNDNKTVLHRAAESQNKEICVEILKLAPHLRDEQDNKGKVPADYVSSPELVSVFKVSSGLH